MVSEIKMETRLKQTCTMAHNQSSPLTHALGRNKVGRNPRRNNSHLTPRGEVLRSKHGQSQSSLNSAPFRVVDHCSFHLASRNCSTDVYSSWPNTYLSTGSECSCLLGPGLENLETGDFFPTRLSLIQSTGKHLLHADNTQIYIQPTSPSFTQTSCLFKFNV